MSFHGGLARRSRDIGRSCLEISHRGLVKDLVESLCKEICHRVIDILPGGPEIPEVLYRGLAWGSLIEVA